MEGENGKIYGAIWGDIIGSPCEFDRGGKTNEFPLFCGGIGIFGRYGDDRRGGGSVSDMQFGEDGYVTRNRLVLGEPLFTHCR